MRKWGPSLGITIDDFSNTTDATTGASLDNITAYHATAEGALYNRYGGADVMGSWKNKGLKERIDMLNTDITTTSGASAIITNLDQNGKSNVSQADTTTAVTNFVAFYLATVKLNMVSDFVDKCPPMKNLKGYLYVNYNAATSSFTSTALRVARG